MENYILKEDIEFELDNTTKRDFNGESNISNLTIISGYCWSVGLQKKFKKSTSSGIFFKDF